MERQLGYRIHKSLVTSSLSVLIHGSSGGLKPGLDLCGSPLLGGSDHVDVFLVRHEPNRVLRDCLLLRLRLGLDPRVVQGIGREPLLALEVHLLQCRPDTVLKVQTPVPQVIGTVGERHVLVVTGDGLQLDSTDLVERLLVEE